jgi:hypothetical protein
MLRGELPISHATLDQHDTGQAIGYLRSWLVTDGILGLREERLARSERWAEATIDMIGEHPDHPHLAATTTRSSCRPASAGLCCCSIGSPSPGS